MERKDANPSVAVVSDMKEQPPSARKLADLRKALAQVADAEGFGELQNAGFNLGGIAQAQVVDAQGFREALETMTLRHDPGPVVKYLVAWINPNQGWRDKDRGYVLGSYFGVRCGKDRKKHFAALSEAKDPLPVRVMGAVHAALKTPTLGRLHSSA